MGLKQRQKFLLALLSDEALMQQFLAEPETRFGLSARDIALIRGIDRQGLLRKFNMLERKRHKHTAETPSTEGS